MIVIAHLEMIDPLQAEESLAAARVAGVARGMKLGPWVRQRLQEWSRTVTRRKPAAKATAADLRSVGIGCKVVNRG